MSFRDTQIALDSHLATLPSIGSVNWENTEFKPVKGSAWLRPTMLNSASTLVDLQWHQQNPGIYRVDAFYPVDQGPKNLLDRLDAIYTHFKTAPILIVGSTKVNIGAISILPRIYSEKSWYMGSIDINFIVYENQV